MYRDPDHDLLSESGITLGTPLKISVVTVQDRVRERLFTGEVTAIELDHDTTGTFTVIRALSKAHRLQRGRKVVAYRNMKTADIVRKVAASAGLTCGKVEAAPITYKQLTQPNVSDWEFLQYLAAESGAQVRVDDKGVLQFTKPKPASSAPVASTPGPPRTRWCWSTGTTCLPCGRWCRARTVRAMSRCAAGTSTPRRGSWRGSSPSASTTVTPGMSPSVAAGAFGAKARVTVADTPYRTQAETTAVAGAVAASVSSGFGEIEAVAFGNPQLRAGEPVALGNVGPTFSGRYTATAAHHVLEPHGGYRTTVWSAPAPTVRWPGCTGGGAALTRSAHAGAGDRRGHRHPRGQGPNGAGCG